MLKILVCELQEIFIVCQLLIRIFFKGFSSGPSLTPDNAEEEKFAHATVGVLDAGFVAVRDDLLAYFDHG